MLNPLRLWACAQAMQKNQIFICPISSDLQITIVLFSIRNSYMRSTRFVYLNVCVKFCIFDFISVGSLTYCVIIPSKVRMI